MPRELILVYGIDRYRLLLNVLVTLGPDRHTVLGPKHGERSSRFHRPRRHPIPLRTPEGFTAASTAVPTLTPGQGNISPTCRATFSPACSLQTMPTATQRMAQHGVAHSPNT